MKNNMTSSATSSVATNDVLDGREDEGKERNKRLS